MNVCLFTQMHAHYINHKAHKPRERYTKTHIHTHTDKETHKLHVCTLSMNKLEEDNDDDHFQ